MFPKYWFQDIRIVASKLLATFHAIGFVYSASFYWTTSRHCSFVFRDTKLPNYVVVAFDFHFCLCHFSDCEIEVVFPEAGDKHITASRDLQSWIRSAHFKVLEFDAVDRAEMRFHVLVLSCLWWAGK